MNNIDTILFDLDGVLFDTKKNMERSWNDVNKHFNLKIKFKDYFSKIGIPFQKILKKLRVKKNQIKIEKFYQKKSISYIKLIKLYPNVINTVNYLIKKNYKIAIVTSKDKKRSLQLIRKFKLNIPLVICPTRKMRGKPYPDQIIKALKIKKTLNKNAVYVGDTKIDYLAAKKSFIRFIFAKYGYGQIINTNLKCISNFKELQKIF